MTRNGVSSGLIRVGLQLGVLAALFVVGVSPATAGLSGEQARQLGAAEDALRRAEQDITAAGQSAGTSARPATGSRLKLTKMRLTSGAQKLNEAAEVLKGLPADDAGVAAALKRHAAAVEQLRRIEALLGAKPPAGSGSETATSGAGMKPSEAPDSSAPAAPRLDYRQEKAIKDTRWNLREVEKYRAVAAAVVRRLDGEGPPAVHADVKAGLAQLATARTKLGYAMATLEQLPADHPQVKPVADAVAGARDALGALRSRLEASDAELQKLTGMEHYPAYAQDLARIRELSGRYRSFGSLIDMPERLAAIIREDPEVMKEVKRVARTYLPLVEQKTKAGRDMENVVNALMRNRQTFAQEMKAFGEGLPAKIDADLGEAEALAKEAVETRRPAYFGEDGGIAQYLGFAEKKVLILEASNSAKGAEYRKKLTGFRAAMDQRAESFREQIIATNQLPPDMYRGADREELVAMAVTAWRKMQADAKVLTSRIPSEAWKRVTEWRHSSGRFYKVDYSKLQVQLIVAHGDGLAAIRPINLFKDHMKGDTVTASPMDRSLDDLTPHDLLKADKIR